MGCGALAIVGVLAIIGVGCLAVLGSGGSGTDTSDSAIEENESEQDPGGAAEEAPEQDAEPAPAAAEDVSNVVVRVGGTEGVAFSSNYGNIDSDRSVEGTVPAEYEVEADTGAFSFDNVSAFFSKAGEGQGELTVQIVADGEVVNESNTTAPYGTVSANWSPSDE